MQVLKNFRSTMIGVVILIVTIVVTYLNLPREDYTVKFSMVSAEGLAAGGRVWINGFDAGWVEKIETRDGKAIVTAGIAPEHAPLHSGTKVRVQWYAALGERILVVYPGPASNPEIPSGGLFQADSEQVELDQVLAALDEPTRNKLNGLIDSLHTTTAGREPDLQATLQTAGPTVQAVGAIFEAVGRDGPAIRSLIDQLQQMIQVTAVQQNDIRGTVTGLNQFAGNVATTQQQLSDTFKELPPTLRQANDTLGDVKPAVTETDKLLKDLKGATHQLPDVADDLNGALHDLRPAIRDLNPTLRDASDLLRLTPNLLDGTHEALPKAKDFVKGYGPAINFLRPYTPELMGWIQNWGKNFGQYDSQSHLWNAILGEASPEAVNEQPTTVPPVQQVGTPRPGAVVGQPWNDPNQSDATGGPVR
jgi:phospholipid/cholesterol/gamma-HCH transport system substrate-binding protein